METTADALGNLKESKGHFNDLAYRIILFTLQISENLILWQAVSVWLYHNEGTPFELRHLLSLSPQVLKGCGLTVNRSMQPGGKERTDVHISHFRQRNTQGNFKCLMPSYEFPPYQIGDTVALFIQVEGSASKAKVRLERRTGSPGLQTTPQEWIELHRSSPTEEWEGRRYVGAHRHVWGEGNGTRRTELSDLLEEVKDIFLCET